MLNENPDQIRERRGLSVKWNSYEKDVIPLWVADMDLPTPPEVTQTLLDTISRSDLGYPSKQLYDRYLTSLNHWSEDHFGYSYKADELEPVGDVVQAIYWATKQLPGDSVIFLTPAYPPFFRAVKESGKEAVTSQMPLLAGSYQIDMEDLREKVRKHPNSILLLCNPHNPTGRVFTRAELESLAEMALENDLWVISDEIHRDILFEDHVHIPFSSISPEVEARTVSLISGSKTFNIAGLHAAAVHIPAGTPSETMRLIPKGLLSGPSSLGMLASAVAFETSGTWLNDTLNYISHNREALSDFSTASKVNAAIPEGTYMSWIDLAPHLPADDDNAYEYLLREAKLALSPGLDFLPVGGETHVRINLATSHQTIEESLRRLKSAIGL
ncbi:cystathione beta-lyase [Ferrithrix thermotolerans DSM 19514]|jgi:cystathionine beta-lyase|uniref:cysteine-S-conjugate beta-lyase n=1 Tax=Ferrithrix thermotolerans DSM 19514 TaxID=1121881 RepID=A0A1M4SBY6_9ACTN|nr:aminotransferase class I/II-fold pyridoxal phosphate-dependent enzyme [Ferrithrix thermotolerans]SHE29709.1 cystathione beta-lyase [Ferrithrix thermotolerans DSM 19514]